MQKKKKKLKLLSHSISGQWPHEKQIIFMVPLFNSFVVTWVLPGFIRESCKVRENAAQITLQKRDLQ